MNLAIFIQHYFPYGGLQRDAMRLATAAHESGDKVTLVASTWDGPKPDNIPVRLLNSGGGSNHGKVSRFATDCLAVLPEYDVCIAFSRVPGVPFHFCGDTCVRERVLRDKPAVARLLPRYRALLANEEAVFGASSDTHIFFLSEHGIPPYKKHYGLLPERFTVLPPWLKKPITQQSDRQETRQRLCAEMGIRQDEPLLLFVASNYRCKGLDRAIQGVAQSQAKPINLVVCGDDKTADMKQLASESGVNIVFAGARDDVDEWMLAADMLIHPARMEAAGMVLTEALVQGLPVLCTENCGYAKHIADAGSVVVSEDAGAQTIAQGIDKILAERVKLSAAALDWVDSENRFQTGETILNTMRQSTTI